MEALQKFEEYTIAIEAGAGVLMNVALEVQEPEEDSIQTLQGHHQAAAEWVGLRIFNFKDLT